MDNVTINKARLVATVLANKEKHVAEYKEAVEDFANLVIKICQYNLDIIAAGNDFTKLKSIPAAPQTYEDSYTKALLMLDYSVDDVISIDSQTFAQLVQDNWSWKHHFSVSNTAYKTSF